MQDRDLPENPSSLTKEEVLKSLNLVVNYFGEYLIIAGLNVNYYIIFTPPEKLEKETCEYAYAQGETNKFVATFLKDRGVFAFTATVGGLAILVPVTSVAYDQITKCLNDQRNEPIIKPSTITTLKSLRDSVITSLSIAAICETLPVPDIVKHIAAISAGIPLARFGLQRIVPDYPTQASWPAIQNALDNYQKTAFVIETCAAVVKSGLAFNCIAYYILDNFVNAALPVDLPYTTQLQLASIGAGMGLGMLSMFNKTFYNIVDQFSAASVNFYLIGMPLISELMCLDTSLADPNNFYKQSLYAILAISSFSALVSAFQVNWNANPEVTIEEVDEARQEAQETDQPDLEYETIQINDDAPLPNELTTTQDEKQHKKSVVLHTEEGDKLLDAQNVIKYGLSGLTR